MQKSSLYIGLMTLVLFISLTAGLAFAEGFNAKKWYAGGAIGGTNIDSSISVKTGNITEDHSDYGAKLFLGYRTCPYFKIEIAYADLGKASITGNTGESFSLDNGSYTFTSAGTVTAEPEALSIEGVFTVPLEEISTHEAMKYMTPFFKVGVDFWSVDYTGTGVLNTKLEDSDGTSLVFGAGLDINITPYFVIRGEFQRYRVEDDVDFISCGLIMRF